MKVFLQKSQTPAEALWSLCSIDLRVIALHPSFVKLRIPQNASLIPLISEPIRVNIFSFVIYKRGNSQYPEQICRISNWFTQQKVWSGMSLFMTFYFYFINCYSRKNSALILCFVLNKRDYCIALANHIYDTCTLKCW